MRRFFLAILIVCTATAVFAQNDTTAPKRIPTVTLPRSNDHFLLQLGYTTWQGKPDSIKTGGIPRTFNAYFMLDFPFKSSPKWSAAIGAGVATDNVYFDKMNVGLKDVTTKLVFKNLSDTSHFKKYKVATTYLEAPVELRYSTNPDDNKKSVKIAVGAKVGTLVNAHTKGKILQSKSGGTLIAYTQKENSKRFFNQTRLSVTGRLGIGHFSVFASYQITPLFKDGVAATIRPLTVGLTLSGL
jgi:hypothetical protein